jgi:hypoxanthine phosphoribosyltransferase
MSGSELGPASLSLLSTDPTIEPLIDAASLAARAEALGAEISADYQGRVPVLLVVMHGALVFAADLMRGIEAPVELASVAISSYPDGTQATQRPRLRHGLDPSLRGRDVIVVEDIVDTGHTLAVLLDAIEQLSPASVAVATCLDKPARRQVDVPLRYIGFEVPPVFVVGYGLDFAGHYRNLPYVARLRDTTAG